MPSSENPAILLIGKTGVGKSTYGNMLYNYLTKNTEEVFEVGDGMESQTTDAESKTIMIDDKMYDLVDMPGYMDTSGTDIRTVMEIARVIENCPNGIMAFLFVIKYGRITLEERNAIHWIKTYFGPEVIPNVILVISNVRKNQTQNRGLLRDALKVQPTDKIKNPLKELVIDVKDRWVISPNTEIEAFASPDNEYWRYEADLLIEYIKSFEKPYTNDKFGCYKKTKKFKEAERHRLDEEDKVKIKGLEQEIMKLQLLAKEDVSHQDQHLMAVQECQRSIDNLMQEAKKREQESKTYLKHYAVSLGIVMTVTAFATLPLATVAAVVGIITTLCLEVKAVEVFFIVAELMPQYSEQINKYVRNSIKL